ncbi:FkbM family methyltransferase [Flavisolibacter tropicus]|uniref:Methyltransferase FkbM domain-containing protein n=1 Tax=Flavisolibacter tropicus TaxID=1492898 RepID=A0A172U1B2_9BACT|nr:FkbM family methyltransferase [Flavisolibacter tropicus]ANE52813.1 hypothetical protein SY85_22390 [Flavisolibacter tropicus]
MISRLNLAVSKLLFCYKISLNTLTFLKLLWNTKRFSLFPNQSYLISEIPTSYELKLNGFVRELYLRTYAGDIAILYEIFWQKAYDRFTINYASLETIVDLGANVGLASLFFKSVSPQASILAVEPESKNFEVLQKNLKKIINSENIIAIKAAVNYVDGPLALKRERFAFNTKIDSSFKGETIEGISLNTLFNRYNLRKVDLLKIDVEGFEHQIFSANLDWIDKVENIIIEVHSEKDYRTCIDTLTQKGFTIKPLKQNIEQENIYWASR